MQEELTQINIWPTCIDDRLEVRAIQTDTVDAVDLAVICPVEALVGKVVVKGERVMYKGQREGKDDVVVRTVQVNPPDFLLLSKQQERTVD